MITMIVNAALLGSAFLIPNYSKPLLDWVWSPVGHIAEIVVPPGHDAAQAILPLGISILFYALLPWIILTAIYWIRTGKF